MNMHWLLKRNVLVGSLGENNYQVKAVNEPE